MKIKLEPAGLAIALSRPHASERLQNRQADLLIDGSNLLYTGSLPEVAGQARTLAAQLPDNQVTIREHSCDFLVS